MNPEFKILPTPDLKINGDNFHNINVIIYENEFCLDDVLHAFEQFVQSSEYQSLIMNPGFDSVLYFKDFVHKAILKNGKGKDFLNDMVEFTPAFFYKTFKPGTGISIEMDIDELKYRMGNINERAKF